MVPPLNDEPPEELPDPGVIWLIEPINCQVWMFNSLFLLKMLKIVKYLIEDHVNVNPLQWI